MPEILGLRKTGLEHLTERTQQDPAERHNTVQESILLMEEKMTDSFTVVTERVGTIFCSAGSSLTIADTVKDLKACRIIIAGKDAPARLAASQKNTGKILRLRSNRDSKPIWPWKSASRAIPSAVKTGRRKELMWFVTKVWSGG
ncbi:MAG: hypothetical protein DSZ32_01505 [Gammaproteobacteria bacterium]|nr:MAG: hypothetical protein DSZ32_01505 [Gammaproteobacteria bacterium]